MITKEGQAQVEAFMARLEIAICVHSNFVGQWVVQLVVVNQIIIHLAVGHILNVVAKLRSN